MFESMHVQLQFDSNNARCCRPVMEFQALYIIYGDEICVKGDTVQSWFSDIEFSDTKFSDSLWFNDYFSKTIFQFTS